MYPRTGPRVGPVKATSPINSNENPSIVVVGASHRGAHDWASPFLFSFFLFIFIFIFFQFIFVFKCSHFKKIKNLKNVSIFEFCPEFKKV